MKYNSLQSCRIFNLKVWEPLSFSKEQNKGNCAYMLYAWRQFFQCNFWKRNRELCCSYLSVGFTYFNMKSLWSLKNRTLKFMKQKLVELKGEIEKSIIIVENFNTSLFVSNRKQWKISKDIENLNTCISQLNTTCI